jgi:hypothetical protein
MRQLVLLVLLVGLVAACDTASTAPSLQASSAQARKRPVVPPGGDTIVIPPCNLDSIPDPDSPNGWVYVCTNPQ